MWNIIYVVWNSPHFAQLPLLFEQGQKLVEGLIGRSTCRLYTGSEARMRKVLIRWYDKTGARKTEKRKKEKKDLEPGGPKIWGVEFLKGHGTHYHLNPDRLIFEKKRGRRENETVEDDISLIMRNEYLAGEKKEGLCFSLYQNPVCWWWFEGRKRRGRMR